VRGRCGPPVDEESIEEVEQRWALPPASPPPASPPPTSPGDGSGTACPFTLVDVTRWQKIQVNPHGAQTLDSTPIACNDTDPPRPPCVNRDPRLARCCLLSGEKGNQACADKLFGDPVWDVLEGDVRIVSPWAGSGMAVKVAAGSGLIRIRGTADPRAQACLRVTATVPPCAVIPGDGGCVMEACP
jgi:hypothetical protein